MMITATEPRARLQGPFAASHSEAGRSRPATVEPAAAPIVVAVDNSPAAAAAAQAAVRLARELTAPLVFVYVRRGPSAALGEPYYQRRLDAEMRAGRRALDDALALAERAGVPATGEQLAGSPARRMVEFARIRGARLVVLGSRRRRLGRSVSRDVIRSADRPVIVAARTGPLAA
jgi:nucleotide-binding universal stress UspA family protein